MHIKDRVKELRRVRAGALKPHPKNWRTHPKAQREALQGILAEVGYADALLARELGDGSLQLIDGHLRAETTPDLEVPVLVVDVTEEEAEKLLVSLDPLAAMAGAESAKLEELLRSMRSDSPALTRVWEDLARDAGVGYDEMVVEDEVPLPPEDPVTRPGDLWMLGPHRLLCGDSAKAEDVDRLLDGDRVHLVNTDPPYNVRVEPRSNNAIAAGLSSFEKAGSSGHHARFDAARVPSKAKVRSTHLRAKDRPLANDFVPDAEFARLLLAWFGNLARVLVPGGGFYIWGGYANIANYPAALRAHKLYFSQAIIWHKQHPVLTRKDFMGDHEWCFYGWKEGAAHQFYGPNNVPDVWQVKKVNPQAMVHLTEKPVELAARAMRFSSRAGEHVLDLFGGSGSTLMAAEQTGRRAFLLELDPPYCDVIVQRWEKLTGKKAERMASVLAEHVRVVAAPGPGARDARSPATRASSRAPAQRKGGSRPASAHAVADAPAAVGEGPKLGG